MILFLGNFYRHLAIFFWSHCSELMLCSVETFKSDSSLTCLILALNVDTLTSQQQSTWYENEENLESSSASEIGENSVGGSASSGGVNSTDSSVNSMSKYRVSVSLITWGLNGGGTWNCFGTVRSARYAVWRNRIGQIFSGETMIERKDLSKCQSRNQFHWLLLVQFCCTEITQSDWMFQFVWLLLTN